MLKREFSLLFEQLLLHIGSSMLLHVLRQLGSTCGSDLLKAGRASSLPHLLKELLLPL